MCWFGLMTWEAGVFGIDTKIRRDVWGMPLESIAELGFFSM
jgi:hypothetical protein